MEASVAEDLRSVALGTPPMSMENGQARPAKRENLLLETFHDGS
jgi:hypothetical protein